MCVITFELKILTFQSAFTNKQTVTIAFSQIEKEDDDDERKKKKICVHKMPTGNLMGTKETKTNDLRF